jgi:hypothetical protein
MLGLLLLLALLAVGVAVLVAVGAAVIQGYLYNQPAEGIVWRSAATGVAVALFFGFWCSLEKRSPGEYESLLDFTSQGKPTVFDKFVAERTGDRGKQEIPFVRGHDARGRVVYTDPDGQPWQRATSSGMMAAIVVDENGESRRFEAEMTPQGTFKIEEGKPLRYVEQGGRGRVMTDNAVGEVANPRYGLLFGNLMLNLAHLLVWFVCLWLLMRFQWPHALGLAAVMWLAFALAVWPVLRERVPHG